MSRRVVRADGQTTHCDEAWHFDLQGRYDALTKSWVPSSMFFANAREPCSTSGRTVWLRSSGKKSLTQMKRQLTSSTG
jgi:hypothetical protein